MEKLTLNKRSQNMTIRFMVPGKIGVNELKKALENVNQ